MTKLRFGIFAIIAISLIMGTSVIMADAAKPVTTITLTSQDDCGAPTCFKDPSIVPICGVLGAVVEYDILISLTDYNDKKFKAVKTLNGVVTDPDGNEIGKLDSTTTTQGFYDANGAYLLKTSDKILCNGGIPNEFIHSVTINNHGRS